MRAFYTFLILAVFTVCQAQEKPVEIPLTWRGVGNAGSVRVNSVKDEANNLRVIIVNNKEEVEVFWLNNKMEVLKESKAASLNGEDFAGGYIENSKAFIFFRNEKADKVHGYVFNLKNDDAVEYDIAVDLRGKKYLGELDMPGNFVLLAADKKDPVISVFDFSVEGQATKTDFNLGREDLQTGYSKNDLWKALSRNAGLSRSVDVAVVIPDIECDIDVADAPNKLYSRGDDLILTMDNEPLTTRVFKMGLKDKSLSYKSVDRATRTELDGLPSSKYNSFLRGKNLYYVLATDDKLDVRINDFETNKELSRFESSGDDEISFKNTPVMQEGSAYSFSRHSERELKKTRQLLRKMTAGRAVIAVMSLEPNVDDVTVGAIREMKHRSPGMSMPMMTSISTPSGGTIAVRGGSYTLPGYTSSWTKATRFRMLVDRNSGKHIPGEASTTINEEIEKFTKDIKIPDGGSVLFKAEGNFRYAYFDKSIKKLVMVNFGSR